ncbi:MAG: [acyl-carrier-protein] S-malonyltransferase [Methylophagaceae bacterium]|jgi:[acyl-carrier-protein] S-malonyltransferase
MSLAFVFPGQGSQSIGMLDQLASEYPLVQQTFAEASEVLGYDLWSLVAVGPETALNQTERTQPAMLAAGIAVWRVWQSLTNIQPDYLAGHSLGEYTALVASGALSFANALKLVELRGQYMQQAVPEGQGAMAAILGLDDDVVKLVCQQAADNEVVEAVNFNSPGQVVIAGHIGAVTRATVLAKEQGAKRALLLPVSVPSHCILMKPAADKLDVTLADMPVHQTRIPVIHNASVSASQDEIGIKASLVKQLHNPVRWVETVQWLSNQGVDRIVECGPGKVLAGLTKRIDKTITGLPVFDQSSIEKAVQALGEEI